MLNTTEFIRKYAEKTGMTIKDSTIICESFIKVLGDLLYNEHEDIRFTGFGVFRHHIKPERTIKHPGTGELKVAPELDMVKFKESQFKEAHKSQDGRHNNGSHLKK